MGDANFRKKQKSEAAFNNSVQPRLTQSAMAKHDSANAPRHRTRKSCENDTSWNDKSK